MTKETKFNPGDTIFHKTDVRNRFPMVVVSTTEATFDEFVSKNKKRVFGEYISKEEHERDYAEFQKKPMEVLAEWISYQGKKQSEYFRATSLKLLDQ